MSENLKAMSLFDVFTQTAETLQEAEERSRQEQGRQPVERFRISEEGEYSIRILPLAPDVERNEKGEIISFKPLERKGFEYPLQQIFLKIDLPEKNGKQRHVSIPVIRSSSKFVNLSDDLIDTYVKIAKEKYGSDEELIKKVTSGGFEGGLKWSSQRAMYVLNLDEDHPKPLLWQASFSQYRSIDDARIRLWKEELDDNEKAGCPVSSLKDAYPVTIIRKEKNKKVEYTFEIARKKRSLTEDEVNALLDAPRIPDIIYRFTRYQLEAEKVALEQFDERHSMKVTSDQEFIDCYNKLSAELPKDDNSHFDLAGVASEEKAADGEVTLDSLFKWYDEIADKNLDTSSDEYQELREEIRKFVTDNNIDVRLSRSMNNLEMLEAIEDAMDEVGKVVEDPEEEAEEVQKEKPVEKEEEPDESKLPPRRTRRSRPSADEAPAEEQKAVKEAEDSRGQDEDEEQPEELPRRRVRSRR